MSENNQVFRDDESELKAIPDYWEPEELLEKEGIFFLKDVVKILEIDSLKVKRAARSLLKAGEDAYVIMGVRKIWNHWIVRMVTFAPYYRENLVPRTKKVDPTWDGNTLLSQDGLFLLTDVCKFIPFSSHQIRYQAKTNPDSREKFGVWKDEKLGCFVVDMPVFARWVERLWEDGKAS